MGRTDSRGAASDACGLRMKSKIARLVVGEPMQSAEITNVEISCQRVEQKLRESNAGIIFESPSQLDSESSCGLAGLLGHAACRKRVGINVVLPTTVFAMRPDCQLPPARFSVALTHGIWSRMCTESPHCHWLVYMGNIPMPVSLDATYVQHMFHMLKQLVFKTWSPPRLLSSSFTQLLSLILQLLIHVGSRSSPLFRQAQA